jgi:hypothetical protein
LTAAAARAYRLHIQQGAPDYRVISVCGVRERLIDALVIH